MKARMHIETTIKDGIETVQSKYLETEAIQPEMFNDFCDFVCDDPEEQVFNWGLYVYDEQFLLNVDDFLESASYWLKTNKDEDDGDGYHDYLRELSKKLEPFRGYVLSN